MFLSQASSRPRRPPEICIIRFAALLRKSKAFRTMHVLSWSITFRICLNGSLFLQSSFRNHHAAQLVARAAQRSNAASLRPQGLTVPWAVVVTLEGRVMGKGWGERGRRAGGGGSVCIYRRTSENLGGFDLGCTDANRTKAC